MKIYIPSLSRSGVVRTGTVGEFPPKLLQNLRVVVPTEQVAAYEENLAEPIEHGLQVLSCPEKGISHTRRWIGEQAAAANEPKFLMLDDDLGLLIRRGPSTWRLRGTTPVEVESMMRVLEGYLDTHACVGISPREGQNRYEADKVNSFAINTRIIRALGFQTDAFLACEHGRVQVMEDFDVLLQLLRRGQSNALLTYFAQGQGQTQAQGGCSEYRTHENHAASAEKLALLHPGYVNTRWKKNKGGGEFGERKEVTIRWKKAFQEAPDAADSSIRRHSEAK